ncbi:MAG: aspartate/glutamate racemase family protein [Sulfurospirillum sp.]|nr:aspartate/glutamate racemase family protein [Sulfurospirillum sp.]
MKTIGLLGGMSWESTQTYYTLLNEGIKKSLGGFHSCKIILYSVDFHEIEELQREGKWEEAGQILTKNAKSLELAGADFILICTNTMHKIVHRIQKEIHIPIIHIAQATGKELKRSKSHKAILLGTRFTMEGDFIKSVIESFGIKIITPDKEDITKIDTIIFEELVHGIITQKSKETYINIVNKLKKADNAIDSVILGCTEIGLLLHKKDIPLQIFDTTVLHVKEALHVALCEDNI